MREAVLFRLCERKRSSFARVVSNPDPSPPPSVLYPPPCVRLWQSGSLACYRPDHVKYNWSVDGYGLLLNESTGPVPSTGLVLMLDGNNATSCSRSSQQAVGQLASTYGLDFGRVDFEAR